MLKKLKLGYIIDWPVHCLECKKKWTIKFPERFPSVCRFCKSDKIKY